MTHRGKSALECTVFLDVLPIFGQSRRSYASELSSSESRFQKIGSIPIRNAKRDNEYKGWADMEVLYKQAHIPEFWLPDDFPMAIRCNSSMNKIAGFWLCSERITSVKKSISAKGDDQ